MSFALTLALAILLDHSLGDPPNLPHPVKLIGHIITFWRNLLFTHTHSLPRGLAVSIMTLLTTSLIVSLTLCVTGSHILVQACLLYAALAWRDLKDETLPVALCLMNSDIDSSRKYLSRVVGRDTDSLDEAGITRAVIETIAENSIDGIISVMFYAALGYALGHAHGMAISVWLFKAASTLDSMLGYESLHEFGMPSARLDDALNFLPARLGGMVILLAGILTGCDGRRAFGVFMADRLKHKSPNSAHGESAFAGVLNVRLGGGANYGGRFEPRPFINEQGHNPNVSDIFRAFRLLDVSCSVFAIMLIFLAWTI